MKPAFILVVLFGFSKFCDGQYPCLNDEICLSKKKIDDWIKFQDTSIDLEKTLYIVDNFVRNSVEVDSILGKWSFANLVDIRYKNTEKIEFIKPKGIVVIYSKYQLNARAIKSYLSIARKILKNDTLLNKPLLYINDKLIDQLKVENTIDSVRWKDIFCISVIEASTRNSYFGYLAKQGIIRIWTKKVG